MTKQQRLMKSHRAKIAIWFAVMILDVFLVMLSEPLSFYVAIQYNADLSFFGQSVYFYQCLGVLTVLVGVSASITWWVWGTIKGILTRGDE